MRAMYVLTSVCDFGVRELLGWFRLHFFAVGDFGGKGSRNWNEYSFS